MRQVSILMDRFGMGVGKFFVGVTMEGASSMVFDVLLTLILLLGPFLLGAALLCTRQAHSLRQQYPYVPRVQTNVAPDEPPTPLEPKVLRSAIEHLPAVATATTSPKDSATPPLEAPSTVKGQPQTIINGAVRSLNVTINNNGLPQGDQAALITMVEVLQALRADINKIGRQVSREHGCQKNPGPGPWASSNFDHYEYGSDLQNDSGWGTERLWRQDLCWDDQPVQDNNNEYAGEEETFETQTAIQERADCNVEAIDLWRSNTEEGAAADRGNQNNQCNIASASGPSGEDAATDGENQSNQCSIAPASGSSRSSCILPQQQSGLPVAPPNPIYRTPTPRSVQGTPSTTLNFTPSPPPSTIFSGVIGDLSTLDSVTLNSGLNSQPPVNRSLQREFEEVERQSAESSGFSHNQSQERRSSSSSTGVGQDPKQPNLGSAAPRRLTRTRARGGSEDSPEEAAEDP